LAFILAIGVFIINQTRHDKNENKALKDKTMKGKETDNAANKAKNNVSTNNVTDVLNRL
jgi:hypothetical protein